jgi:ribbon-helix-helix protein
VDGGGVLSLLVSFFMRHERNTRGTEFDWLKESLKFTEDRLKLCCGLSPLFASNTLSNAAKLFSTRMRFVLDRNICSTYIHAMKRISMFLSDSQITKLKKLAKRTGIKMSELVRRFIDEGLKKV